MGNILIIWWEIYLLYGGNCWEKVAQVYKGTYPNG